VILVLFRGWIYRSMVHYTHIGERPAIELTNAQIKAEIDGLIPNDTLTMSQILKISNRLTRKKLRYTSSKASRNPNELCKTGKANCIGYSAMFNSIANYLIQKTGQEKQLSAHHYVGSLDLLGLNLHSFFDHPFFRDHDFNQLKDNQTGETLSIDPSMGDYLKIEQVSSKN